MAKHSKTRGTARNSGSAFAHPELLSRLRDWHCVGFILLVTGFFFRDILLQNAFFWEDFLYQNYPFRSFAATSLALGQLPLWNPYTFNGMPFLADIQTTVLYLPSLVLTLFVSNGSFSFYWLEVMIIGHYALAGTGMYYLTRSLALDRIPSVFAAIAFMISGYMITHAIHQQIITLVAWYPVILLLFRRSLLEHGWQWPILAALALGHSTLAGFPQLSLYLYFFLLLYFLFELIGCLRDRERGRRIALVMTAKAGGVVLLSVLVAMVQLLPTWELATLSQRAHITYEKATEGSLAWPQLTTLIFPKLFGTAGAGGYQYWGPGTYWYYWETCIYLGVLPFTFMILSLMLLRRQRIIPFIWGIVMFALLFALGDAFFIHELFYHYVPGFDRFRNPARMGIFLTFGASILSAFTMQALLERTLVAGLRRLLRNITLCIAIGSVLLWILIITGGPLALFPFLENVQIFNIVRKEITLSLLLVLASTTVAILLILRPSLTLALLAPILLIADMTLFGGTQNNSRQNPSEYFGRSAGLIHFLQREGEKEFFRINTRNASGMIMDRNQGMVSRVATMEGYTPLVLQRVYAPYGSSDQTYDLLNVKYKTITDTTTRQLQIERHETYLPRAFFLYDVYVARSEEDLVAHIGTPSFDHRRVAVLEKDPGINFHGATGTGHARIRLYENNRIDLQVTTDATGILVLSEMYYPGWKAYINGNETEIFRTDYNLRSIVVGEGTHEVSFRFEPSSLKYGFLATLGALVLSAVGLVVPRLRRSQSPS